MNDSFNKELLDASEEEREMLDYLIEQERQSHLKSQRIHPRSSMQNPPLSFAQQRLWVLEQMVATGNAYNWCLAIRFRGMLSPEVVAKCLTEIVRRHEVLRTTIEVSNSEPYQVINPSSPVRMDTIEFTDLTEEEADRAIKDLVAEAGRDIFDLARGPLLKVRLLGLGDRDHVLILSMHHIVSDGWSLRLLLHEFTSLYKAYRQHQVSPLPELSLQYADYSVWQRNWLVGEVLERQLVYWRQQLQAAETLALPTDRVRPAIATFNGNHEARQLDNNLKQSLTDLAQREGVTLFILTLSAFVVLLHKYCAQDDIVVGSPVASRNRIETENLIGFFVNMLVFRTDTSGDPTFRDVLARVMHTGLAAFEHQDIPFERLVEALAKDRDMSRNPLFQVSFALQQKQPEAIDIEDGLSLSRIPAGNTTVRFDLELFVSERQQGLEILAAYNTDLFDAGTIERMLSHYQLILEAMVTNPDMRISAAPMLGDEERQQVVVDWNQTLTDYPRAQTVQALFEAQVSQAPDAPALEYDGDRLSYAELNERANQLAHHLRDRGVGAEVKVGLFVERGLDMVVALLGILKAGGAYVPLDLDYPASRIAFMLDDAEVPVLLTTAKLASRLPEGSYQRVCLDTDWAQIEQQSANNPEIVTTADSLAYLIYTSGSTGTPKGVEIVHRAINRLVKNTNYYRADASDRIAQASSNSFDAATFEVWGALLNGAQLVGIDKNTLLNSNALAALLREKGITAMFITTAVFNQIAREVPGAFQGLRALMFGGEAVDCSAVRRVLANQPPQRLLHVYGPTESTTFATWYPIEAVAEDAATVPIGRPLANTTLYVLDTNMKPMPVGVSGELYIGGDGLARGYLNRAELTAERFVPNPFEAGGKLYRTGDKVRYLSDGNIEFQGRFDHQIKLRGFRIELGEIETALLQLEAVSDAVVIMREDDTGDKRLDAYVVPTSAWVEQNPGTEDGTADGSETEEPLHHGLIPELRQQLRRELPSYMLPSVYVLLDALPLNPNGKVDREALPVAGDVHASLGAEYTAPRNEIEQQLAGIWAEVLKLERIGIHDNFFDLGGHSLLATRIVSHIREQMNVELALSDMFDCPTVAGLAAVDRFTTDSRKTGMALGKDSLPLQVTADLSLPGATFPLSFAQERLWYIHAIYPHVGAAYNISFLIHIDTSVSNLEAILEGLQQQYAILRTTYALDGTQPVQTVNQEQKIVVEMIDKSDFTEAAMKQEMVRHSTTPFDLETGPVWRSVIIKQGDRTQAILITIHHIAADGRSTSLLRREMLRLCQQKNQPGKAPETKSAIQYIDYALWQREYLGRSRLEVLQSYWEQKLSDVPTVMDLPIDKPRAPMYTHSGAMERVALGVAQSNELRQFARDNEVTLFMLMLAIFKLLLSRYAQQADIVVGTAVSGRTQTEMDDIIGLFVNSLVLRSDLSGSQSFTALLKKVRNTTLEAFDHQDLPFEKIVEIVQPERDLSRNPVFQVMFTFNIADGDIAKDTKKESALLSEEIVSDEAAGSHVDLTLNVVDYESRLLINFDYNDDLFEAATMRRMLTHYRRLLEVSIASPETSIDRFEILTAEEKQLILNRWNQTQAEYIENETLHSLFERQVKRTPQSIAVSFDEEQLSYLELEQKANQVAGLLVARNIEPGQLVGIYMERSIDLVVALLGVLKAGAVYVPLDPDYPQQRNDFIISDANIRVLLSQEKFADQLASVQTDIIHVDKFDFDETYTAQPLPVVTEDMLAYVIYTSGSTGEPKGVMVSHKSVVNHACWISDLFEIDQNDRVLQSTPISFDASVGDIFPTLLNGARIVMAAPGGHRDSKYLLRLIRQQEITIVILVPAALRMLLQGIEDPTALQTLKRVGCGGEAVTPELQREYYRHCSAPLYNLYGPTETTVDATSFLCEADFNGDNIPIGTPVSNSCAYILDQKLQPVPIGVHGELHIGGRNLAQGYLNRPELTAEKFISNPFANDSTARLYKTGDLARYRADGNIEFIGRVDMQVKIRGFRIELDEIESILMTNPGVQEVVVIVREDEPDDKRLVAYVVIDGEQHDGLSVSDLRTYTRGRLPDYMVPSTFVILDSIPLGANDKLDRRALPMPDAERQLDQALVEPRSDLEQQLVEIWQDVLGIEQVGTQDNFFDLGGHSLKLVELHNKLGEIIESELTLVDLFAHPTVSTLVEHITRPQTPIRARSDESGRASTMAVANLRLKQLRKSRKHNRDSRG